MCGRQARGRLDKEGSEEVPAEGSSEPNLAGNSGGQSGARTSER